MADGRDWRWRRSQQTRSNLEAQENEGGHGDRRLKEAFARADLEIKLWFWTLRTGVLLSTGPGIEEQAQNARQTGRPKKGPFVRHVARKVPIVAFCESACLGRLRTVNLTLSAAARARAGEGDQQWLGP